MLDSDALLKELLATFELEAREHLGELSSLLLSLEREPEQAERLRLLEGIFRRVHTLKGAAHAVNLHDVAQTCQRLEDVLADLKRGDTPLGLDVFDALHGEVDGLSARIFGECPTEDTMPATVATASTPPPVHPAAEEGSAKEGAGTVAGQAKEGPGTQTKEWSPPLAGEGSGPLAAGTRAAGPLLDHPSPPPVPPQVREKRYQAQPRPQGDETVRVSARLLEELLLQSEELVSAKLAASVLHEEVAAAAGELSARQGERTRALEAARKALKSAPVPGQAPLAALLEQSCQYERQVETRLRLLEKSAEKQVRSLQAMIDPLLEEMKKLQLLPCSWLLDPFAKQVRDLSRELGKEAEFTCTGGELEIDRRILSELKEPLLHLVRNTVDHGIEDPRRRAAAGKPEKGDIRLELRLLDANRAELVLRDDGAGIDLDRVKRGALRLDILPREELEAMPDDEALQLIFESGISTSETVSGISGRGVGLAIVRESLERLGGDVRVCSSAGAGTRFRLTFPLSFARMRALLVQVAGRDCAIPAANVALTSRAARGEVKRVENRDTVLVNGEIYPLVSLGRILELERGVVEPATFLSFALLYAADKRIAFAVDQVLEVQEILVKPLGRQLSRVRNVAGATVLGNGRVVPVLNVADLFRSAVGVEGTLPELPGVEAAKPGRVSVLVVEDSITSRTLLKNILEAAGYEVSTAVDGADALARLKAQSCDVVVSDIEMPRMDGFQLTAAIRADGRLASLPVILVTGLESRTDRERGIDAGASAYLVKSSFDQTSLIEVIHKLTH